jgi:aryl-alcohol dehydrogenase-like predicted oxidoreductase
MEFTTLGRTGMRVSRLCLGTMNFGPKTDENDAFRIMDTALELGINFFDTANVYGGTRGRTEEIIGKWFAQGGGRREKVVLATKVYGAMQHEEDGPNDTAGLSAYKLRRHLEGSLRRLQTDHVELYQMHHVDRNTTWEELWDTFQALILQGKIYYVGSSNFAGWHLAFAQAKAREHSAFGLVSEQHLYNLMNRQPELEVLPSAEFHGIGVIPWSPLAGGLLGGHALSPPSDSRSADGSVQERAQERREKIERFHEFSQELGCEPANVALSWLLHNSAVTAPIIGPRTVDQLITAVKALEVKLGEQEMAKLDDIFPGPGKPAPEAYAW